MTEEKENNTNIYININRVAEAKGLKSNRSLRLEINKPESKYVAREVKVNGGTSYEILYSSLEPGLDIVKALLNYRKRFSTKKEADSMFLDLYNSGMYLPKVFKFIGTISIGTLHRIVICTANDKHLLDSLKYKPFTHINAKLENPKLLGFECHKVLKQNINKYDYYCFMEDDLIINDSLFFEKLNWFNKISDITTLLQPNRYEISSRGRILKLYIDGDIKYRATKNLQNVNINTYLQTQYLDKRILFKKPLNPHSGCFFLTNEQMLYWISKDYFLNYDTSFISPLESAATLGISKTFNLYKPETQNACFFEIQHFSDAFLLKIARKIPVVQ